MKRLKDNPMFSFAIVLLLILLHAAPGLMAQTPTVQSQTFSASGGATTQILASGGVNAANSYPVLGVVMTASQTGGTTASMITGTQNGNSCVTSPTTVFPSVGVSGTNAVNSNPGWVVFANPVYVVAGSSALCISVTGGTVTGLITFLR